VWTVLQVRVIITSNTLVYCRSQWPRRFKAWVCGRQLVGIAGSIPSGGVDDCLSVMCCQVEVSATGRSLVRRNPNKCNASKCDREVSTRRRTIRRSYNVIK
jgi:hypothetical protein